jgi:hypothetical protein
METMHIFPDNTNYEFVEIYVMKRKNMLFYTSWSSIIHLFIIYFEHFIVFGAYDVLHNLYADEIYFHGK